MNISEIRNLTATRSYFAFSADSSKAVAISDAINNVGFDTVVFVRKNETHVVVLDNSYTESVLKVNAFPILEDLILQLLGEVNYNLGVLPSTGGVSHSATRDRKNILQFKRNNFSLILKAA